MAWFAAEASLFTCAHPARDNRRRAAHAHGNAHAVQARRARYAARLRGQSVAPLQGTGRRRQQALGQPWHLDNDL